MSEIKTAVCPLPNGERIFYRSYGEGADTLLLLHGNLASSRFFEEFFPYLKNCRIIAPDMRGYGDSSYDKPFGTLVELAEDFSAFCNELGLKSIFAGGWSTGGTVAMELAAIRPDLVKGLVLISSVSCQGFNIPPRDEHGDPMPDGVYPDRESFDKDPMVSMIGNALKTKDYVTLKSIWDSLIFTKTTPGGEEYTQYLEASCKQRSNNDAYWALTKINMTDSANYKAPGSGHINLIKCPVLAFHGDDDLVLAINHAKENKAALGDKMELIILENCSHASYWDHPNEMAEKINSFIGDD
ncbi:MAG: alpha/beta hydrolase [Oscillospiraceae bacterium]|nr:alpha/beta hydrolase [Oscillospiraceae bacterium]